MSNYPPAQAGSLTRPRRWEPPKGGSDSLTWAYSGKNDAAGDFYGFGPFSGTLTISGGTGKFAGARGRARFTAASGPTFTAGPSPIQFAGTAFYYLHGRLELTGSD